MNNLPGICKHNGNSRFNPISKSLVNLYKGVKGVLITDVLIQRIVVFNTGYGSRIINNRIDNIVFRENERLV